MRQAVQNDDTTWLTGDAALKEWAQYARYRGPDWPTSCTLHRAVYGRGGIESNEMPVQVQPTDQAVARLSPLIKAVVRSFYVDKHKSWRQHAKELQISRRDFEAKLRVGQCSVAKMIT